MTLGDLNITRTSPKYCQITQNLSKISVQVSIIYISIHIKFGMILFSHFLTLEVRGGLSTVDFHGWLCHWKFEMIQCCPFSIHVLISSLNNFQISCFLFVFHNKSKNTPVFEFPVLFHFSSNSNLKFSPKSENAQIHPYLVSKYSSQAPQSF